MIFTLIRRNITGKPFRFLLTCSAVTMGVMFTVGVFVFTDGLRATFGDLAQNIEGGVDYAVRSEVDFGDRDLVSNPISDDIVASVASVDGVVGAQPRILKLGSVAIDGNGIAQESNLPNIGLNWEDSTPTPRLFIHTGRPPTGSDEFVIDADAFDEGNFVLGTTYTVINPAGPGQFELVGTFFFAAPDKNALVGAKLIAFDTPTARDVINNGTGYDQITFETGSAADPEAVRAAVAAILPDGFEVVTGDQLVEEQSDDFNSFIDQFQTFMLVFAFIILLVSAFVIFNVFTILIGQRIRELGLLRAIGASGSQVTGALLGEAFLVGIFATVIGTALGIGFGWGLRWLLNQLDFGPSGNDLLLEPATFVWGIVVGIGVTMASAITPALRARRISPMAALREDARLSRHTPPANRAIGVPITLVAWSALLVGVLSKDWMLVLGLGGVAALGNAFGVRRVFPAAGRFATLALGIVMLALSLVLDLGTGPVLALLGIAAATIFLGVNSVSPILARPMSNFLGRWPLAVLLGIAGVITTVAGIAAIIGSVVLVGLSLKDVITDFDSAGIVALFGSLIPVALALVILTVGIRAVDAAFIMGWHWQNVLGGVIVFVFGAVSALLLVDGVINALSGSFDGLQFVPIGIIGLMATRAAARRLPSRMKSNARMARENAGRSPRRTASAAAALMIGLALVSTATVVASSFKATFADILEESVTSDWFIAPNQNNPNASFSSDLGDRLQQLDEVDTIVRFQFSFEAFRTTFDNEVRDSSATDMAASIDHLDPDFVALDESLLGRNAIWVHEDMAADSELTIGSTFDIEFPDLDVETVIVAGIFADSSIYGNRVIDLELWTDAYPTSQDQFISVTIIDGVDEDQARAALSAVTADYPTLNVDTREEFQERQSNQIDQALIIINVLLLIAIVIALLGIAITLALSVFERTRELGLVRAVGMTTQQMLRMVLFEGAIIAAFGGLLGIILGTAFGTAAVSVMPDAFIRTVDIPVLGLLQYLAVASVAGIAAAIIPARRAARLKILDAIAQG